MICKSILSLLCLVAISINVSEQGEVVVKYVHANNGTEIKEYGEVAEQFECAPFDPQMTEPINVKELDQATLLELLVAYSKGNVIEMCIKKEKNEMLRKSGGPKKTIVVVVVVVVVIRK